MGGLMVVGVVYIVFGGIIKVCGVVIIYKLLFFVVVGFVIMVIGLGFVLVVVNMVLGKIGDGFV